MAKFCRYCGRQLREGEVCNCTRQNQGNARQAGRPATGQQPQNSFENQRGGVAYNAGGGGRMQNGSGAQGGGYPPNGNGRMQNSPGAQGGGYVPNGSGGGRMQNGSGMQGGGYPPNGNGSGRVQNSPGIQEAGHDFQNGYGTPDGGHNLGYGSMGLNKENGKVTIDLATMNYHARNFVKDPVGMAEGLATYNTSKPGLLMVVASLALTALSILIGIAMQDNVITSAILREMPVGKIIFALMLTMGINYLFTAGTLAVISKGIFHADTSFSQMITLVGVKALMDWVFLLLGCILGMLNAVTGAGIYLLGELYATLVLYFGYGQMVNLSGTKKAVTVFLSVIFTTIILVIVGTVVGVGVMGEIASSLF